MTCTMRAIIDGLARFGLIQFARTPTYRASGMLEVHSTRPRRDRMVSDSCTRDLKRPQQDTVPLTERDSDSCKGGLGRITIRYSDRRRVHLAHGEWRSETRQEPDRNRQNGPACRRQSLHSLKLPPKFPTSRLPHPSPKLEGQPDPLFCLASLNGVRRP